MSNPVRVPIQLSLRSLFVLMTCVGCLLALFLPAIQRAREEARRMSCQNNIRQLALACLNYEASTQRFPFGWGGPAQLVDSGSTAIFFGDIDSLHRRVPIGRYSGFVSVEPMVEAGLMYQQIEMPGKTRQFGVGYDCHVAPWDMLGGKFTPWRTERSLYRCPSDPSRIDPSACYFPNGGARTNYAMCYGDTGELSTNAWHPRANRGMFQGRYQRRMRDIADGHANAILLGEISTAFGSQLFRGQGGLGISGGTLTNFPSSPITCMLSVQRSAFLETHRIQIERGRGMRWHDGGMPYTGFNTILPPNSPSCTHADDDADWGYYPAASYHVSGVHVVFVDCSVRFIHDSIDAGDRSQLPIPGNQDARSGGVSKFGVWGALGAIDDMPGEEETVD